MNIAYFKDMDSLYIEISPENPTQSWEAQAGVVSENGRLVGIEIEKASTATNLDILKIGDFPGQIEIIDKKTSGSTH